MWLRLIGLTFALPFLFILYAALVSYYDAWQYNRKAAARGCKPSALRPYKYPGGFDMIMDTFNADKRHQIPNFFEDLCFRVMDGKTTFRQYFFGSIFEDFELGPMRRGNFFPMLGNGIFTADGEGWVHGRALLRPQFARQQVADLDLEERHVTDMLRHMPINSSTGWTDTINLQPIFFRLTLDSATEFLFGESVHSQVSALPLSATGKNNTPNPTGLDLAEVGRAFDRATHSLGKRARFAEQYWMYNPPQFRRDCALIHQFADFFVNRALTTDLEKQDTQKYVFLNELAKATRDPIEIRSQLLNIFLAGRDTTAGLLGWVFFVLSRHPDIFEKLRGQIIEDFGTYEKPRNITFATLKACTYLQYVLNETLRLYPSVPLNGRTATKDTTIPRGGGPDGKSPVFIPKGRTVDYAVHVMHRRKDIWGEDAWEFKPERWAGRKGGWEFLPFNGGPRICLGQQFALTEAGYVVVRLLQKFDKVECLSEVTEGSESVQYQYSVTTAPWEVTVRMREARM